MRDVTNGAYGVTAGEATTRRYGDFADDASGLAGGRGAGGFDMFVRRAPTRRFPFVERRARVDAYGEAIDVNGWLARGRVVEQKNDAAQQLAIGKRKREEEEEVRPFAFH